MEGLGVAVAEDERMPNSSCSLRGRGNEALRAATSMLAREGCGPID
jgi:hypothetical protein